MIRDQYGCTLEKLLAHAELNGKKILEIGCGSGQITQLYADSAQIVIGIEPEWDTVCGAARIVPNAFFLCGSGMCIPFPSECFDIVLFTLSLHHHPNYLGALSEARRVVMPGGLILVLEPTPESEIQRFCKVFEDEDHRLIAVENIFSFSSLEILSRERFDTSWEFLDFKDAASYAFTYYGHSPDKEKCEDLKRFLGPKAHDAPIHMSDTLQLTCLRRAGENARRT
jgi:SAM-dependent methyltransferase